jgi:hypothetical protein
MSVARSRISSCVLLAALACSFGCDTGASAGARRALIDRSGGELAGLETHGARVVVPAGAVDVSTVFTIESGTADSLAPGIHAVGPMITLGPEGARFAVPVRITLPATHEPMVLLTRPHGARTWERVDGAVWDAENGVVTAEVMHFSDFVPVARDEGPGADAGAPHEGDGGAPTERDAGDFCTMHPRDPACVVVPVPLPGCDAVAQDCPAAEMCIAADQEQGYDWGDGRDALCIAAGTSAAGSACDAPSDCAVGTQCVFSTMYDPFEGLIWFSQEPSYLPMHDSFCLPLCAHASTACPGGEVCHPIQLWGFSGREVNEAIGVCAPPPPDSPPRG